MARKLPNRQTLIEQKPAARPTPPRPPAKGSPPTRRRQEVIEERPSRGR